MLDAAGGIGLQEVSDEGYDISEGSSSVKGSISNENILPVAGDDGIKEFFLTKREGLLMVFPLTLLWHVFVIANEYLIQKIVT